MSWSHLPPGQSRSQEKGRGPAGGHSTLPISPKRGLSQPKALAHLGPSLSPLSQPEGVAQQAGPSGALARPWSWLGKAACRQLPASRGGKAEGCALKGSKSFLHPLREKSPSPALLRGQAPLVTRERQKSFRQRARHPGRWDVQQLRYASPSPCPLAIQPSRSPHPWSGRLLAPAFQASPSSHAPPEPPVRGLPMFLVTLMENSESLSTPPSSQLPDPVTFAS